MARKIIFFAILIVCLPVFSQRLAAQSQPIQQVPTEVTDTIITNVAQAIEDELYDYKREGLYFEVDGNDGGDHTPATISLYVSKEISPRGVGIAVYKDMPYGQVYRYFTIAPNGLVTLSGDAEGPFHDWGGSVLTVYMKTDVVCDFIQSKSRRSTFSVDPNASAKRIDEAIERQIERIGYSFRRTHRKKKTTLP